MNKFITSKVIIILGYTLYQDGTVSPILESRLNKAYELYSHSDIIVVSGKMPPKAIAQNVCHQVTEAEAMKQFLISKGIPESDIVKEENSTTTFANAYFSYQEYIKDHVTDEEIYIVSNEFHMPLVKYCFNKVLGRKYNYHFTEVPDSSIQVEMSDINQWKQIIKGLVENCYPLKYSNIDDGDIDSITKLISLHQPNTEFEANLKALLNLETNNHLEDFI